VDLARRVRGCDRYTLTPGARRELPSTATRATIECLEIEYPPKQRPAHRHVCHEYSGGCFADIPELPHWAEGVGEGIVFVEHGAHDDEDAEGEEDAEDKLAGSGELRGNEEGEGNAEHHYVGGDVEDGVGD